LSFHTQKEMRNACAIPVEIPKERDWFEDIIWTEEMDSKEMGFNAVDWFHVAHDEV
jgi:hypothetical protein